MDVPNTPKTREAFLALADLLTATVSDGQISDDELRNIQVWRACHRRVLRHESLAGFCHWLDQVTADGLLDLDERQQMHRWAEDLAAAVAQTGTVAPAASGDAYLAIPTARRRSWRADASTERQIAFLIELGESEASLVGITKGEASERITRLLEARDEKKLKYFRSDLDQITSQQLQAYHQTLTQQQPEPRRQRNGCGLTALALVAGVGLAGDLLIQGIPWP